ESGDKLWINLYVPSTAEWKSAGLKLTMDTSFPEGDTATLTVTRAPMLQRTDSPTLQRPNASTLTLAFRRPPWAKDGFAVRVNNDEIKDLPKPDSYLELTRTWKDGDTVSLTLPKSLHLEPLPDNSNRVAILWGPLVL